MASAARDPRLDDAFERIEQSILPTLTHMLEAVLDAAAAGTQSSADVARQARAMAEELDRLNRLFDDAGAQLPSAGRCPPGNQENSSVAISNERLRAVKS